MLQYMCRLEQLPVAAVDAVAIALILLIFQVVCACACVFLFDLLSSGQAQNTRHEIFSVENVVAVCIAIYCYISVGMFVCMLRYCSNCIFKVFRAKHIISSRYRV